MQPAKPGGDHLRRNTVSIPHPPGRVGATSAPTVIYAPYGVGFQSSPTWSGGCNDPMTTTERANILVSILTHLVGWVQRGGPWASDFAEMSFQSSPTWSGGCNLRAGVSEWNPPAKFQSSPTWSGGCNPGRVAHHLTQDHVSILTHLVGWVQPSSGGSQGPAGRGFNPHPPGRVGATSCAKTRCSKRRTSFNPHPPGRVGATRSPRGVVHDMNVVSILTHLVGWVQPAARLNAIAGATAFQSSPTWSGGATGLGGLCSAPISVFGY